jgi:3-hydroxyisobutyrate dehydrogenase
VQRLADAGAVPLSSNYEVDVIITMLPDGPMVSKVITEVLTVLRKNNTITPAATKRNKDITFIDCSTIGPVLCKELHSTVLNSSSSSSTSTSVSNRSNSNIVFSMLDAPVSGGVNGATNATLTLMVGGTKET